MSWTRSWRAWGCGGRPTECCWRPARPSLRAKNAFFISSFQAFCVLRQGGGGPLVSRTPHLVPEWLKLRGQTRGRVRLGHGVIRTGTGSDLRFSSKARGQKARGQIFGQKARCQIFDFRRKHGGRGTGSDLRFSTKARGQKARGQIFGQKARGQIFDFRRKHGGRGTGSGLRHGTGTGSDLRFSSNSEKRRSDPNLVTPTLDPTLKARDSSNSKKRRSDPNLGTES